jgi:hypothetical protein
MSQAGKFIPGGANRKSGKVASRTGPIRATDGPDPSSPGSGPASRKRFLGKGSGLVKPVPKKNRLPILIMSSITCCALVSVAWYEFAVLPAKRQAELDHQQVLAAQKQLADELAAQKAAQLAALKAAEAHATVTVNSVPSGTASVADVHQSTPATFSLPAGKATVFIQSPGYEDFRKEINVTADQKLDLGTIQLVPETGNLSLSSPEEGVTYTLTGPNNYSRDGQIPDQMESLPAGDYQLTVKLNDWQLPPMQISLHDRDNLQRVIKFPFGSASITSEPAGATVREGKLIVGQTPLTLAHLRPGDLDFSVDLPPYTLQKFSLTIPESGNAVKDVVLQRGRDFIAACGMPMVWINGYWAGKYDVTQSAYQSVMGRNPSTFRRPNRPVETVSWNSAMDFCDKLNDYEKRAGKLPPGYHYTLPTEVQWEEFNADADINDAVMSRVETLASTQDVGSSTPNKYGLYDTLGNVWEWCLDNFDDQGDHTIRGGNWLSSPDNFPSAETRSAGAPKYADRFTGFRVVLVPDSK